MYKPKISVVMPVYIESNEQLHDSITSIINQTFSDFEFLIMNNNPEDKRISKILLEFQKKDNRIRIENNSQHLEFIESVNHIMNMAKGSYIARMDSDDIAEKDRLSKQFDLATSSNADLIAGNAIYIDEDGTKIGEHIPMPENKAELEKELAIRNIIVQPGVLMKASTVKDLGGYRDFPAAEDYDLWLRFIDAGYTILGQNEHVLRYRIRQDSLSHKNLYKTYLATKYVKQLHQQRMAQGIDDYSENNLQGYLDKFHADDPVQTEQFNQGVSKLSAAKQQIKRQPFKAIANLFVALVLSGSKVRQYAKETITKRG